MKTPLSRLACVLACFVVALSLHGCATIMNGTSQEFSISSTPSSARVFVDGLEMGTTPMFVKLARNKTHVIRIEMDGYRPSELAINRRISGWVWGNIVIGGLIGLAVDAGTGGIYTLSPDQIYATLATADVADMKKDGRMLIATVLHPDEGWRKIGELQKAE